MSCVGSVGSELCGECGMVGCELCGIGELYGKCRMVGYELWWYECNVWSVGCELCGECGIWRVSIRSGMWGVVWLAGYSD